MALHATDLLQNHDTGISKKSVSMAMRLRITIKIDIHSYLLL